MMVIHATNIIRFTTVEDRRGVKFYTTLFYVSLVNGLANIFINNFIHFSLKETKPLGVKKKKSFYKQLITDIIFLVENIVCIIIGCYNDADIDPLNNKATMRLFITLICASHLAGIILKIIYYKFLHVWKDLTPSFDFQEMTLKRNYDTMKFKKDKKSSM